MLEYESNEDLEIHQDTVEAVPQNIVRLRMMMYVETIVSLWVMRCCILLSHWTMRIKLPIFPHAELAAEGQKRGFVSVDVPC